MNNQSYEITVDTRKSISHSNIEFSQNNLNISELIFNITEDGTNFTLNDTDKIIVYFEKPDKTVVFQDKEVELLDKEKGKIKVLLTSQTLVKAGDVKGQISIERTEDGTRKRVNTYDFSFKVRSSIASNDSIESTNEFQIFDKIMVAGEKFKDFEGEDFDKLIAAGELAKGALPKSGGTMTGNVDMDISVGSKSKGYRWRDAAGTMYGLETSTTGELILYDYKSAARVWQYDPVGKRFSVISDGNVLKTTGGTMTGNITLTSGAMIRQEMPNAPSARGILYIDETSKAAVGGIGYARGNSGVVGEAYMGWGSAPWDAPTALIVSDTKFTYKNKPVAMRDKDGRADLVLTADAINFDTSFLPVADRRGNTVTISGAIALKTGSVANLVTTLPVDMRPVTTLSRHYLATDGTSVHVVFNIDGTVRLGVNGKNVYITETFVVN
ncbi:BppU family phage baseplate upper protein [Bacillus sp. FSL W8-0519]|uniref:BppU family phage baseplate upper protein n=1 Tax=Bacillus TaxID=1386 RepID=UPI0030F9033F